MLASTANRFSIREDGISTKEWLTIVGKGDVGLKGRTNPTHPLHVGTNATNGNGAHLTDARVWANGSSRQHKEKITRVDGQEAIETVKILEPEAIDELTRVVQEQ
jgi:hypothetical protein